MKFLNGKRARQDFLHTSSNRTQEGWFRPLLSQTRPKKVSGQVWGVGKSRQRGAEGGSTFVRLLELSLLDELSSQSHEARRVHVQHAGRSSAFWRQSHDHPFIDFEMLVPPIASRIEQVGLFSG